MWKRCCETWALGNDITGCFILTAFSLWPTKINTKSPLLINCNYWIRLRLVIWRIKKIEEGVIGRDLLFPTSTKHASYLHLCTDPIFNTSLFCSLRLWKEDVHSSIYRMNNNTHLSLLSSTNSVYERNFIILIISTKNLFVWRDIFSRAHKYYSTAWELFLR